MRVAARALHTAAVAACVITAPVMATAQPALVEEGGDSEWLLAPYLWAPDFKGSVGLGNITVPLDVRADELLSDVDAGAMGLVRWTRGPHFVYLEGMGLAWNNPRFDAFYGQNVEATLVFAELGYGRHFRLNVPSIALGLTLVSPYVGLRYAMLDVQIVRTERLIDPVLGLLLRNQTDSARDEWLDPAVGIIVDAPLTQALSYVAKLDGAGFGIGRSRYLNAIGGLRWRFAERWSSVAGYRYSRAQTSPGGDNDLALDATVRGPMIGVTVEFR